MLRVPAAQLDSPRRPITPTQGSLVNEIAYDSTAVATSLLILRVCIGLTMSAHGYGKFFRGGRIPGTAGWFDSMGMKPGKLHALLAATTEVGSGLMLAAGLLTPLASAAICSLMLVAAWTVHRKNGFFIVGSGWEYNFILAVTAICIAGIGPGRFSLDRALKIDDNLYGWVGLAIATGVGIVAGAGLLAVFYRPPAATD